MLAAREPSLDVRVRWHPFRLNPDLPPEGVDRRAYLEAKFGGPERAARIYERVAVAGRSVGIPFAFESIRRQPNTQDAHRLIAWVQSVAWQRAERGANPEPKLGASPGANHCADPNVIDSLVERIFRAIFVEGRYLGDRDELVRIASECCLDATAARALLDSDRFVREVRESNERAQEAGIDGVPFFIFDSKVAVAGAQALEVLLDAIATARSRASTT